MKKLFSFLLTIFTANALLAQSENDKIAFDHFQKSYNSEKYDEIFDSFSPEMKQALPIDETQQFLMGLKQQAGEIENKEFISYQQETYASYKTYFEKTILTVNISLDRQNQINGLFIKPYEEPEKTNRTINALNNYPKEIAEAIFSESRNLPNNAQLSIAMIQNGKTEYYGIIKENDSIKPIENERKVFEIGSITKVFSSTVLASLVEDKKLKLTDAINAFYPFDFKNNITIDFKSLANHTSGLPRLPENLNLSNTINPYKNYHKTEIDDYLKNLLKLHSKTYAYSNLGAGLLGYTLGLSQETDFQTLLQKKIFDKYSMNNTFTSSLNLGNKLVKGLNTDGTAAPNWDFDVLFGGGGILSTVQDLAKFANAQFNPKNTELTLTRTPTFEINENMKIGLGWHILTSKSGKDFVWHSGGTGGYSSSMAVDTEKKTAIIILSNVSDINTNIDNLCFDLMKKMYKE